MKASRQIVSLMVLVMLAVADGFVSKAFLGARGKWPAILGGEKASMVKTIYIW